MTFLDWVRDILFCFLLGWFGILCLYYPIKIALLKKKKFSQKRQFKLLGIHLEQVSKLREKLNIKELSIENGKVTVLTFLDND